MTDWYLLRRFRDHRSEAAFSQLVSRYIKLVYAVCYAELQNAQAAEDATQAVFLILARKPPFQRGTTIAGWLYQTAKFVSKHARRAEIRRGRLQSALETMQTNHGYFRDAAGADVLVLTDALGALRETDREALLLRYYQNMSLAEVGQALGVSDEAARKRIARGLGKMRSYLERHGAANAIGVLTAGLAIIAPLDARSEVMIHAISQNLIPTFGIAASTAANQLTLEVLKKMAMMKWKWTVACAIVIAGAGSGTAYVMGQGNRGTIGANAQPVPAVSRIAKNQNAVASNPNNVTPDQAQSLARMKKLGIAVMEYCMDYKLRMPSMADEGQIKKALYPYAKSYDVFIQPASGKPYQFNVSLSRRSLSAIKSPAALILFYEAAPHPDGWRYIAYADGHVKLQSAGMWAQQKKALHIP